MCLGHGFILFNHNYIYIIDHMLTNGDSLFSQFSVIFIVVPIFFYSTGTRYYETSVGTSSYFPIFSFDIITNINYHTKLIIRLTVIGMFCC